MSIKLDNKALDNIKNYRYSTNGLTFLERLIMDPFWNLVVKFLPEVREARIITEFRVSLRIS
jgi:hypothetical protein